MYSGVVGQTKGKTTAQGRGTLPCANSEKVYQVLVLVRCELSLEPWADESWGDIETTKYSRSLSSRSSTRSSILSLSKRNCAFSPMGSSTGCLSSLGRIVYRTLSVLRTYCWHSKSLVFMCAESVPTNSPAKLLPFFSSSPHFTDSIFNSLPLW